MAPGRRIQKWFQLFQLTSATSSHHARRSGVTGLAAAASETTTADSNLASGVASPLIPAQIGAATQATMAPGPTYCIDSEMAKIT